MLQNKIRYIFQNIEDCNMCGAPNKQHKLMGRRLNGMQSFSPWNKRGITVSIFQCQNCKLIFSNPQPIPIDIQDHYDIAPEDYWSVDYLNSTQDYFSSELNKCKSLLNFSKGMKALDIGAGLGKCMAAMTKAGYEAYGIEPSHAFHERAINKFGFSRERLHCTSIEEAKFAADEFDFITFGAVLEHLYDPSASISAAMKWLKPGGIIYIEVPSANWLVARLVNAYYKITMSGFVCNLSPMHSPYHLYEFGLDSFYANGTRQGYTVAAHEYYVCRTYLPNWIDPAIKPWMRRTKTGMQLCVWLRKNQ